FLQHGYPFDKRPSHVKTSIAQALGTTNFSLLELVPRKDIFLQPLERVYIGDEKREKIHHVNGKIGYRKLTTTGKSELFHTIKLLVEEQEERFVGFFNDAMPLNLRVHTLELLPGVGKKHTREIIDTREAAPFKDFDDIRTRVKSISDPVKLLVNRISNEVEGMEKFNLFVR
ncbi:DUF655 domain-containing protein, partial [Candidatus Woesearchaeota archaeon]|nr:DUF655 domain-containing protein [Candidatus Woesearchaeota archaeon]